MKRRSLRKLLGSVVPRKTVPVRIPLYEGRLLQGRTALITGGTGGIGAGVAARFVANGCNVILTGTKEQKLKTACTTLGENQAAYLVWDMKSGCALQDRFQAAVDICAKQGWELSILVNCAGVHGKADFWNADPDEWDSVLDINLKTVYFLSREAAAHMRDHKIAGNILNVSSASALKPAWTPYEVSKWGIRAITLGIAGECIPYGITVNAIAPGPTATEMLGWHEGKGIEWRYNPAKRLALPEEIGNWAVFMVSDMGKYIVGDTLYITGGSGTIDIGP